MRVVKRLYPHSTAMFCQLDEIYAQCCSKALRVAEIDCKVNLHTCISVKRPLPGASTYMIQPGVINRSYLGDRRYKPETGYDGIRFAGVSKAYTSTK